MWILNDHCYRLVFSCEDPGERGIIKFGQQFYLKTQPGIGGDVRIQHPLIFSLIRNYPLNNNDRSKFSLLIVTLLSKKYCLRCSKVIFNDILLKQKKYSQSEVCHEQAMLRMRLAQPGYRSGLLPPVYSCPNKCCIKFFFSVGLSLEYIF